ncbi:MAG: hypothetical protein K8S97_08165 [Anaerolineae bacterium]|nr:hypothetical protein [Anaerolineae bacterium]
MTLRWRILCVLLLISVALTACQQAEDAPPPTSDQESIQAASTLFAQPTSAPRRTATFTPGNDVELDLNRSIAQLEQAVRTGDLDGYLAYVWDDDPVFLADHTAWAHDWLAHPLEIFDIELYNIRSNTLNTAEARMTFRWRIQGRTDDGSAGGATVTVVFYREDGTWKLGGELWETVELDGMTFYYFANDVVDNTHQASIVIEYLPSLYQGLTYEFGFVPDHTAHIRMYATPIMLQNWTRISQHGITRWNEPGEAIKIPLGQNDMAPHEPDVARELTHFLLYEMSAGMYGNFPWWLRQGIVEYGGMRFSTQSRRNRIIDTVAIISLAPETAEDRLFAWADLETRPVVIAEREEFAILQAYAFVYYIAETYEADARNAWIQAIATDQTVEEATETHLGLTLEELDAAWQVWLPTQL